MHLHHLKNQDVLDALERGCFNRKILHKALLMTGNEQEQLFRLACDRRNEKFTLVEVEVRSVLEISNKCKQRCRYCNMGERRALKEYMIDESVMVETIDYIYKKGRRVVLLQSGE